MSGYIPRWFTNPQIANPAVDGWQLNWDLIICL